MTSPPALLHNVIYHIHNRGVNHENIFIEERNYARFNPQKHKFVEDFRKWKHSSYGTLLSANQTFLQREQVMNWFSDRTEFESLHTDWIAESESVGFARKTNGKTNRNDIFHFCTAIRALNTPVLVQIPLILGSTS